MYTLFGHETRPVTHRYIDPLELVWYATAKRLGLRLGRNPHIFSMSDGTGLLELGTRDTLDADDNAAQMIFHELVHWITNGLDTYHARDWDFAVTDEVDWREFPALRLQAALADRHGLRRFFAPTSGFRTYYDQLGDDPFAPLDDTDHEARVCARARQALADADAPPFAGPLAAALVATRALHDQMQGFLADYQSDVPDDSLPSLWDQGPTSRLPEPSSGSST